MALIDFGRSFICGDGSSSSAIGSPDEALGDDVRFWVESILRIHDDRQGTSRTFLQCGACKAENTFDAKEPGDLFKQPNYDYLPVLHEQEILVFRRGAFANDQPYKSLSRTRTPFGTFSYHLVPTEHAVELDSFDAIAQATGDALPLIARCSMTDATSGLRAEVEFPVKTMNIRHNPDQYQVDTGPVVYPDLSQRFDDWAQQVSLAYVAFNAVDFVDFILEVPLPLVADGRQVAQIMHYAEAKTCVSTNRLWALTEQRRERN